MKFLNQYHKANYEGAMAHYAEWEKLPLNFENESKRLKEREERCRQRYQDEVEAKLQMQL
ncbi:MAG: hypothetical protein K2K51_00455 [Bacteroidales bacterium]|nr:hypothetical protein [Bacteroidales bacterium]